MDELNNGLRLGALGYGAANLGNLHRPLSDEQAWAILTEAWDLGVRYFDTAPHYGLGLSERRLGAFLRTKPRDEFVISTKVGRLLRSSRDGRVSSDVENDFHVTSSLVRQWDFSREGIRRSVAESLERTGLDRFDILFLHDPERFDLEQAYDHAVPALVELRDEGVTSQVGVGSMSVAPLHLLLANGGLDVLMVAGRYTLLEQPAGSLLDHCAELGVGVVAASIFNSGLLASLSPTREGRYEYGQIPDELWARLTGVLEVCRTHGVDLPAAAIQFPLRHQAVRSVAFGASRPEQVVRCLQWAEQEIPEAFWNDVASRGLLGNRS